MSESAYSIHYPGGADVDDLAWHEIEAKGFLPVSIVSGGNTYAPVFYDSAGLQQDATVAEGERFTLPAASWSSHESPARTSNARSTNSAAPASPS